MLILRPPRENWSDSILVKGQGPAIQETLTFRNCRFSPASKDSERIVAFHLRSGEHGGWSLQGTFPVFEIVNVRTAPATTTVVVLWSAYLTRMFPTLTRGSCDG
jgi:hypothetical protein